MYADLTLTGVPSLDSCISSDLKEWGERFVINYVSHTDHFQACFCCFKRLLPLLEVSESVALKNRSYVFTCRCVSDDHSMKGPTRTVRSLAVRQVAISPPHHHHLQRVMTVLSSRLKPLPQEIVSHLLSFTQRFVRDEEEW